MSESLSYKPRTPEAARLLPDDLARVATIYAELCENFPPQSPVQEYTVEELATSALKIEQFDATIALIKGRFETESRYAWDATYQKNCHLDYRQFSSKRKQTRSATIKTAELAEDIASAWSQFTTFVENNQKHLITLDELWKLMQYEGLSSDADSLDQKALWLALHFLAHNTRQEHFIKTWIRIDRIRDDETFVERLSNLISAMPDQATVHEALLAHSKSRIAFWEAHAAALRAESDQEKARFLASFQGTRETRDQLRFQLTCRRFEVSQYTRLKKEAQRFIAAREKEKNRQEASRQRNNQLHRYSFVSQPLSDLEYLENLQNQDFSKSAQEVIERYSKIDGDDPWLDWVPEDDDLDSETMLDDCSVKAEDEVRPPAPPLTNLLPPNPDGKHYTWAELNKVDDVLQIVILEYLGMLPSEIKHNGEFIDGMSDANNYFDFLRDGIKAICATTIPRLQELRRKLNELKPTELSITGSSSIHGIRLSNQLRMDITAEMLKPHANRARREAAARSGNKNLPKRLFKRDRQKSKPPD